MQASPRGLSAGAMIAIVGPWLHNKGDVLMLRSVQEHYPGLPIGTPSEFWPDDVPYGSVVPLSRRPEAAELGASVRKPAQLARLMAKRALLSLPPAQSRRISGRVAAHRAAGLLDCSGFAYGDVWSTRRMIRRRDYYRALRRQGVKIAVLPQAFGPFERPEMRQAAQALLGLADLVVARDVDSMAYLRDLGLDGVRLWQAPDITHLLSGQPPTDPEAWRRRVCIVPNTRMVDRTSEEAAAAYVDFLVQTVAATRGMGLEPWLVLHEANDAEFVRTLNARLEAPLPVLDEDAVATKGIFACCHAVVASRYHALISAFSHGIPVMGMSWSHKYERLFEEYGHGPFMLSPSAGRDAREALLQELLGASGRTRIADHLARVAEEQKARVRRMWREVDAVMGVRPSAPAANREHR